MKHPEDKFIFGEHGYWYVVIEDIMAGYFHYKKHARAYIRLILDA
jgi:hypothetical protein